MSASLHTDPNPYKLIETFSEIAEIDNIAITEHLIPSKYSFWNVSQTAAGLPSAVVTLGELTNGAGAVTGKEVASVGCEQAKSWYFELGTLAANEIVRLYVKKKTNAVDRDNALFDGLVVMLKNSGGLFQSRMGATIAGALDATDQTAYAEHVSGFDGAAARFGALVEWDGKTLSLTIGGVTTGLLMTTASTFTNFDEVGLCFNTAAGTAKIYEVRAW